MNKDKISISSPDDLNSHLQRTSIITWLTLILVILVLGAFFVWASIAKIPVKVITGDAHIQNGNVTLHVEEKDLEKLKVGQTVYILEVKGEILSIEEDGQPVVSTFDLPDQDTKYTIWIEEIRPIEFLLKN